MFFLVSHSSSKVYVLELGKITAFFQFGKNIYFIIKVINFRLFVIQDIKMHITARLTVF